MQPARLIAVIVLIAGVATAIAGPAPHMRGPRSATRTVSASTSMSSACDDAVCEVHTARAFRVAMARTRRARPASDLSVRSGFRTRSKQAALYKLYRKGEGNLAAAPGYSNHESGRALDLYVTRGDALSWLEHNAGHYGFHRTVPGEAWHWEYLGDGDREHAHRHPGS